LKEQHINISEILDYAKELCPSIVCAKIQREGNLLVLGLKWKYSPKYTEQRRIIHSFDITLSDNDSIIESVKRNLKSAVCTFGKEQCDELIDEFDLHSMYKAQYEDTNVLDKTKIKYEREINKLKFKKNLSFYLYDEIKVSFSQLFYFWIQLVKKKINHNNSEEITDMIYSIIENIKRLYFVLLKIKDIIHEAKHFGNPDVFFLLYHNLASFISLAKTVGDNLAWILNLYLNLNLNYRHIDLFGHKLPDIIKLHDKHLFNLIYATEYFKEYKNLVAYRDIVQHRHIIKSMRVVRTDSHENLILIPKDPEKFLASKLKVREGFSDRAESQYKIAENVNSIIRYGLHDYNYVSHTEALRDYISPLEFCNIHFLGISNMLNDVFKRITDSITSRLVAKVTKFYSRILVAEIFVDGKLEIGDGILIEGKTTSFRQNIQRIEFNHKPVKRFDKGLCAIQVNERVRTNDKVYLLSGPDSSYFLRYLI
jgi:hypothetical protein